MNQFLPVPQFEYRIAELRYNPAVMAAFNADEVNDMQLDWVLLRDGGIGLYWRQEILADDLRWFQSKGYQVISFDASNWHSKLQMHEALKAELAFPGYYGKNMDALDECMSEDLVVPDIGGLAIVMSHYDQFANNVLGGSTDPMADVMLDIFARAIRYHMLFGRRLLVLVRSDDPKIQFGRLGGIAAQWNWQEWLNKNRGL